MNIAVWILLLNMTSTLFMVGLIWFVQIVHYPLMGLVGKENYETYQEKHQKLTTWVVGPPMLIEAFSSMLLVWFPPVNNTALLLIGIALLFIIWVSTALLQVPCHGQLLKGFDAKVHWQLVLTNWIRTICWTLRGVLVVWLGFESVQMAAG